MIRRSIPSLVFLALTLTLFWRVFLKGETLIATDLLETSALWRSQGPPPKNPWLSDSIEFYYPSERLYSQAVRQGRLPLVNPHIFNGAPVPHGIHIWNSVWPVKLAFLWAFDPIRSYDGFALFHFWLAGVAMTLFLRSLGIGDFGSLAAALGYDLSGRAMLWLHGHYLMATLAYVPLLFLAARRRSLLGAVPMAGLCFTNPQLALAAGLAVVLWERDSWRWVVPGMLIAAVALVPLAVTVAGGVREPRAEAGWFYSDGFRSWLWLAGLVAPGWVRGSMPPNEYNVYLGLLPLLGAVAGARRERFFAAMAGMGLAVATLYPLPVWIAPVSFSLPTRYLFFFTFGASVCFARALDARPARAWLQGLLLVLILVDLVPRFRAWNPTFSTEILRERPAAVDVLKGRVGVYLPDRGRPFFPPLSLFGIDSVQGYDVMVPRAQRDAIRGAGDVAGQRLIRLSDPESPVLDRLGMKYLIAGPDYVPRRFRLVYEGSVRVFENPFAGEVGPRAVSRVPLWIGLGLTLLGCGWILTAALLDRSPGITL